MEIAKYEWETSTRPCRFCLCLQGGSVFADFDVDSEGRAHIVRISFDGYGCCATAGKVSRLSIEDSRALIEGIDSDEVNCDEVSRILYRYLDQNKDVIWRDALAEHELLKR